MPELIEIDSPVPAPALPVIEERFCAEYARHNDIKLAWRVATNNMGAPNTVALRMATHMYNQPGITERVEAIRQEVSGLTGLSVATVLTHWWNLAIADPTEIIQHRRNCCRYCYGQGGAYQWTTAEYLEAGIKVNAASQEPPDCSGGFDFDGSRGPNPDCTECFGEGVADIYIADTRYLSERGKMLFAGIEQNKYGVKVHLRDQMEAWNNLARFFSMFQEKLRIEDVTVREGDAPREDYSALPLEALVGKFRELVAPPQRHRGGNK